MGDAIITHGDQPTGVPAASAQVDVRIRYWAGAAAAAGKDTEVLPATTVAQALDEVVRRHPALERVVAVSTCLLDGVRVRPEVVLASAGGSPEGGEITLEILPPFAGG